MGQEVRLRLPLDAGELRVDVLLADELLDLLEHLLLVLSALKGVWSWGEEQKWGAGLRGAGGQEQSSCNQPASELEALYSCVTTRDPTELIQIGHVKGSL